ncbi:hypothetical protein CLF_111212 [Clonorchis sinensis]|uniref:Uncharacterized protein n=1 Tax=Clonorchis sinensis TaxID=79923 RepID=G7YUI3_CLOSI|nr:hypothetical protein CLF_111212 [Clonorchis sinensis]
MEKTVVTGTPTYPLYWAKKTAGHCIRYKEIQFKGSRKVRTNQLTTDKPADLDVRRIYQNRHLESLPTASPLDLNSCWTDIATSLHSAGSLNRREMSPTAPNILWQDESLK